MIAVRALISWASRLRRPRSDKTNTIAQRRRDHFRCAVRASANDDERLARGDGAAGAGFLRSIGMVSLLLEMGFEEFAALDEEIFRNEAQPRK
ncbi:hypothetical protein [Rhodoblastus sp.]|uniref:hypothetical protein n=1 Tax=Rhodoblastus sp. TaxID=1962975 RepID=UPI00260365AC|nr:hypothetical protein [Rhodoblastus sp.]